jgi:asparagine synthase (glutamine-hydrolysing)
MLALKGQRPDQRVLVRMVETLQHRGPDNSGYQVSGPCGLGNTRLAVIDLSEAGRQPMHATHPATSDKAWIVYNGEVYNFAEVRPVLEAAQHSFFSQTDTETILRSYLQFGAPDFIRPFRGMFALAIWDMTRHTLILMRDRLGKKPLYYWLDDKWLVFGSEIKALLVHPAVSLQVNRSVIPHYLAYGYPPAPQTLFEGIYSLPPGHMLLADLSHSPPVVRIETYWTPPFPSGDLDPRDEEDIVATLLVHLRKAVQMRMIADVPLGAFLSGGLDSSAIVALMAQESRQAVKTFSIGFSKQPSFNETLFARQVATQYGTEHHEFIVEPHIVDLVDELVWYHDQPFGDSSAIPTYLVSKLAREYVTVALTGDGGDELFAGYERFRAACMASDYARWPNVAHHTIKTLLGWLPESTTYRDFIRRAKRFVQAAQLPLSEQYLSWVRYIPGPWVEALVGKEGEQAVQDHYRTLFSNGMDADIIAVLLDLNLRTYLPNDLLVKMDRCSMAASLETRSPFLDHQLVEFAASIPSSLKLKGRVSKYILKRALRGLLPPTIIDRKKHGFGVPVGAWFRNELLSYAQAILLGDRATRREIFNIGAVRAMLNTHVRGQADLGHALWTLLTFELWMQRYFD